MTDFALSNDAIATLKRKHVEFLKERLRSEAAREDWLRSFRAGYGWVLGLRVEEVVDTSQATHIADAILRALDTESVKSLFLPIGREIHRRARASLQSDTVRIGEYVPPPARLAIDELLERSDLLPERLIRNVFDQDVVEDAIRDLLYDGLKEFNSTVNPFFAEWGLPALLKRMPIGGGTIAKSMGALRGEFDKRLDPEIRKFLLAFSRKSKIKLADFVVSRAGDPKSVELRKNVVSFLYAQTFSQILAGVDEAASKKVETAAEHVLLEVLRRDEPRQKLKDAVEKLVREQGTLTITEWLIKAGASGAPNLDAWAELGWPYVRRLVDSPVAHAFFEKVIGEFYDSLTAEGAKG